MESNVVEIAPPVASCSRAKAETPEVIDVEEYDLQNGGVLNGNNVDNKNKGKAIDFDSVSYDEQDDEYVSGDDYDYPESSPISNSLLDPDTLIYEDDENYSEQYDFEMEEETDNYSMYQDLFDGKDIPTGVEVSMDWFPNSADKESASGSSKSSNKSDVTGNSSKKATKGSGIQSQFSFPDMATPIAQPWNALPHKAGGVIPNSAYALPQNSKAFQPPFTLGSSTSKTYFSNHFQPQTPDTVLGEAPAPAAGSSGLLLPVPPNTPGFKGYGARYRVEEAILPPDASRVKRNMEDFLGLYLFFKRFDIVEDFSDHHYATKGNSSKQHSKDWAKRIQDEWKILEKDLPDMIFVRAYESRMDLLRAVIIGAQGTPYHDGLFFFDIFFPDTYPSVPPTVHYHSGGLRINPNLYNCGKVCLSLLGTWSGSQREKWIPNTSTMLQVLVSIQGLILNQKPYFNEPGYESSAGSAHGENNSKAYSENTLLLSLKTMVYTMRRPPKYFEDFAYGHFFSCAHDVLKACNAYRNGGIPGFLVKGAQDAEENSANSSSKKFRTDVATFVETVLLKEFILLGVLGLEPEGEDKAPETNNVAESSHNTRSSAKRDRVSSS
ncbi:Ubiquitin-conjugating enzyme/RWD-like [Arabidopsis thaliana x Arabidopsis arenosa]|uniref:E2 ubiquitin-conjugating enzyme n=1 Tax=Arabidopsis thaliana x Arabidopsis arenosa TaxID=1240361 RepID=A0A8T2AUP2_9BRAS|nr:Ubiquitin-conjugating enzyme/RWD-like [Arabidopsis thaliana x Arabidopsis arenosa]